MCKPFKFKEFIINQKGANFKVGTDSILLGAWTEENTLPPNNILDVGTGTGLLALMMAQKFPYAQIDAIDIQQEHTILAQHNFSKSKWSNNLKAISSSIQNFKPNKKYDLIIANPPYFNNSLKNKDSKKTIARHASNNSLTISDLIKNAKKLLAKNGSLYFCYPNQELVNQSIKEALKENKLYKSHTLLIKPNKAKPSYLSLYRVSTKKVETQTKEELIIYHDNMQYSEKFKLLTKPFYLNI